MAYSPRMQAALKARFEKLSAKPSLTPAQQRSMDRLGGRLGVNQAALVKQITGMGPSNPTPGGRPLPLSPPQGGPGPGHPELEGRPLTPSTTQGGPIGPAKPVPSYAPAGGGTGGGMSGAMGMPDPSLLPAGAMFKKGGKVKAKKMASGGMTSKVSSASRRGDGIAQRGKTKGRMC